MASLEGLVEQISAGQSFNDFERIKIYGRQRSSAWIGEIDLRARYLVSCSERFIDHRLEFDAGQAIAIEQLTGFMRIEPRGRQALEREAIVIAKIQTADLA